MSRLDVQVPAAAAQMMRRLAADIRAKTAAATRSGALRLALGTVNAPRLHHLDAAELVAAILSPYPDWKLAPHIEALFDEVSEETLHDLVLDGVVTFEDLARAIRTWRLNHARTAPWVIEMADLSLARSAAAHH